MNPFQDPSAYVTLCAERGLLVEEFALACLVFQGNEQPGHFGRLLETYLHKSNHRLNYPAMLKNLENKGLLENQNPPGQYHLDKLRVTNDFKSLLLVEQKRAFEELLAIYPPIGFRPDDSPYCATAVNLAVWEINYWRTTLAGGDHATHRELIELTHWYYTTKCGTPKTEDQEADCRLDTWLEGWPQRRLFILRCVKNPGLLNARARSVIHPDAHADESF